MKIVLALSLAVFTALSPARARLGETEGQSQQRYGQPRADLVGETDKPLMPGAVEKAYEYQGWRVRAAFAGGQCLRIEYAHIPDGAVPKKISDAEITAILEAEKAKFSWREDKTTKQPGAAGELEKALKGAFSVRKWRRADHATAELALGIVLKLETRDAEEAAKKLAKQTKDRPAPNAAKPPKF